MKMSSLKKCIENGEYLYINEKKIKILEIYEIFNLCEIIYLDDYEIEIIDVMAISNEKKYNKFISLHRFKEVNY